MTKSNLLDQFYTNPTVAAQAAEALAALLPLLGLTPTHLLEPAAGAGALLEAARVALPQLSLVGGDLEPKHPLVKQVNFLTEEAAALLELPPTPSSVVTLGNPPFGKRGKLAREFLEKSLQVGVATAFILPVQFRKYLTQRMLPENYKLVADHDLPSHAFIAGGKPYHVNCCLQVWTVQAELPPGMVDLRRRSAPPRSHPAFDAWIYNATPQALKVFQEEWTIAVKRQGWEGFSPRLREDLPQPNPRQQWMLLRGGSREAHERLLTFDYQALAALNTSVGGFGKADLVEAYSRLYGSEA